LGYIAVKFGQKSYVDLIKIKILYPQKHLISYGYGDISPGSKPLMKSF